MLPAPSPHPGPGAPATITDATRAGVPSVMLLCTQGSSVGVRLSLGKRLGAQCLGHPVFECAVLLKKLQKMCVFFFCFVFNHPTCMVITRSSFSAFLLAFDDCVCV